MNHKHPREEIVEKGVRLFRLNGYTNTGMDDILKHCGISKGTFYNYFGSKERFLEETLKTYSTNMIMVMDQNMNAVSGNSFEKIKAFFKMVTDVNEQEGCIGGCLVNNMSMELAGISNHLAAVIERSFNSFKNRVESEVTNGQIDGSIRTDISAADLTDFIYTGLYGSTSFMKTSRSIEPMRKFMKLAMDFIRPN